MILMCLTWLGVPCRGALLQQCPCTAQLGFTVEEDMPLTQQQQPVKHLIQPGAGLVDGGLQKAGAKVKQQPDGRH